MSIPEINSVVPVTRRVIAQLDYDGTSERPGTVNVRVKQKPLSWKDAPLFAPYHYLKAEEVGKIACHKTSSFPDCRQIVNRYNTVQ